MRTTVAVPPLALTEEMVAVLPDTQKLSTSGVLVPLVGSVFVIVTLVPCTAYVPLPMLLPWS